MAGRHADPHAVLGCHRRGTGIVIRVLWPGADAVCAVFPGGERVALERVHPGGLFAAGLPGPARTYRLAVRAGGAEQVVADGYRRPPTVGEPDLVALAAGHQHRLWTMLGARPVAGGTSFAVWAPRAVGVRLRAEPHGRAYPLRRLGNGVWEVWLPDVPDGSRYRFEVLGADGCWREKADPLAAAAECPPGTASVVFRSAHRWTDRDWLARRASTDWVAAPVSVYQVHLGSWAPGSPDYRSLANRLAGYVRALGFTHVQLLPLAEHPFGGSWGYQVSGYFAPTARYGDPDGLRELVDGLHAAGIGVFFDVVPAHFARDDWALGRFDGLPLYEHPDPRLGEQPVWGTRVFDFDRPEVRAFLLSAALYWVEEFHADGLRIDAVSAMLYRDFLRADGDWLPGNEGGRENLAAAALLRELTGTVHARHPGVLVIAEEVAGWPGVTDPDGLGFDLKWNLGWAADTFGYLATDPAGRAEAHHLLTKPLSYAFDERFLVTLSHDDAAEGVPWDRLPGGEPERAAATRALLAYQWAHPGKQLLFMGGEFGRPGAWDGNSPLPWRLLGEPRRRGIRRLVARLNAVYRALPALHTLDHDPAGLVPLDPAAADVLGFLRIGADGSRVACVANLAATTRQGWRIGLPGRGPWFVVLDTELARFGGAQAVPRPALLAGGQPCSVTIDLAPRSVLWLTDSPCTARVFRDLPE